MERQRDGKTERLKGREMERQIYGKTYKDIKRQGNKKTGRWKDRDMERQKTERQKTEDRESERHIDGKTDRLKYRERQKQRWKTEIWKD